VLDFQATSQRDRYHHEVADLLSREKGTGLPRPVGASHYSQARYWIPAMSGTPVATFAGQDYSALLQDSSYVLYEHDQDSKVTVAAEGSAWYSSLADPLRAPAGLEAVYYSPSPRPVVLYRILEQSWPATIVSASVSSELVEAPAAQAFDGDSETWWSSEPQGTAEAAQRITLDLGSPTPVNRIWLLPRLDGQGYPAALRIETSEDGSTWQQVAEDTWVARPTHQSPHIVTFPLATARWVRIAAQQLDWDEQTGAFLACLSEVRLAFAVQRASDLPLFSLEASDLHFDPLSNELVAVVHNDSGQAGGVAVEFSAGWSPDEAVSLGTVRSATIPPGGYGVASLVYGGREPLEPGHCRPIWATLLPGPYADVPLDLDTYGMTTTEPRSAMNLICAHDEAVIDSFDYPESPLLRGWTSSSEQGGGDSVTVVPDDELEGRVMQLRTKSDDGLLVGRWMSVYHLSELSMQVRSESAFLVYVRVRALNGEHYYVVYVPHTWSDRQDEYPDGRIVYHLLGPQFADG